MHKGKKKKRIYALWGCRRRIAGLSSLSQLEVSMKHHTHAAGGIWPTSRCRVPETGAPPFPARTVWQHVAQHSTQGPQREKGQLALWPPGEGSAPQSWDRLLPGLSSSTRPYPGRKSCHNVSSAGRPFGATRFAKIWSPTAEGGARPHQARQTHCKGIEGPMVSSRGGMRRPVTAQGPANLVSYRIASIHLP